MHKWNQTHASWTLQIGSNDYSTPGAIATAAVPSHFYQSGHSITDIELIPLELQPKLSPYKVEVKLFHQMVLPVRTNV